MPRKKIILPIAMPAVAWLVVLVACAAPANQEGHPSYDSQLLAEHSMMKKRLPLIERENDILKKENDQQRTQIQELEDRISDLNRKLTGLEDKYTNDIALAEDRIVGLQETLQENDQANNEKIRNLVSMNQRLEEKMKQTVESLNKQMTDQKKTFDRERGQILQTSAEKEKTLTGRLNEIQETLKTRESEIVSLKKAAGENAVKLKEKTTLVDALKKTIKDTEAELESVRAMNTNLAGRLKSVSDERLDQGRHPQ